MPEIASMAFCVILMIVGFALSWATIMRFKRWNHRPTPKISQEEEGRFRASLQGIEEAFHDDASMEAIDAMHAKLCDELNQVRPGC